MSKKFTRVFQFKISLRDSRPLIWRRIQVPENYTFWDLHVAIQNAMGWLDYHLHEFRTEEDQRRNAQHIGQPDDDAMHEILPERREKIRDWFSPGKRERMVYDYDFGDGWEHDVVLERVAEWKSGVKYPRCLAGEMACPLEDSGGLWGYYEKLDILKNPKHPEYEDVREWVENDNFDPEKFDLAGVRFQNPEKYYQQVMADEEPDDNEALDAEDAIDEAPAHELQKTDMRWEVDFRPSEMPFGKVMILLVVDANTEFIFGTHLCRLTDDCVSEFRQVVTDAIMRHKILPKKFIITRNEVGEMLEPIAREFGVDIETAGKLSHVRSAKSAMRKMLPK